MLQLGSFTFDIDDYPTDLQMGGSSLIYVEQYPGGKKSVQDFGAFDDPISLTGTFMYSGAVGKMESINRMWFAGQPVLLTAPGFSPRYVKITAFKPVYHNDFEIDYDITLEPLTSSDINEILYGEPQTSSPSVSSSSSSVSSSSHSSTTPATPTPKKPQRFYVVKSGDSLWKIAARPDVYGNGEEYPKIAAANHLRNPNKIEKGQRLVIP